MCGIIGYIGQKEAAPLLLDGLRRLEYRGYDSAGLALLDAGQLQVRKKKGNFGFDSGNGKNRDRSSRRRCVLICRSSGADHLRDGHI